MPRYIPVPIEAVVHVTGGAFLLRIGGEEKWVPKSLIQDGDDENNLPEVGEEDIELEIAAWFAEKEGMV